MARSGKHMRIVQLSCLRELNAMLLDDKPVVEIARWLQEEKRELSDMTRSSVITTLYRYKKDMPSGPAAEAKSPAAYAEIIGSIEEDVDVLNGLTALLKDQLERIEIGRNLERNTKFMNKTVGESHGQVRETLRLIHEIQMDLGKGGGRNLGTIGVRPEMVDSAKKKYGPEVVDTVKDSKSSNRILSVVKRLISMREEPSEVVIDGGGSSDHS